MAWLQRSGGREGSEESWAADEQEGSSLINQLASSARAPLQGTELVDHLPKVLFVQSLSDGETEQSDICGSF